MTAKLLKFETPEMTLARISRENRRYSAESKDKMLPEKQWQVYRSRVLIEAMMNDAVFHREFEEFERLDKLIESNYQYR